MIKTERKHLPGKDKIRALKRHFIEKKSISEVCESEKILPSKFYNWQRELFDKGEVVFESSRRNKANDAAEKTIAALRVKIAEKNEVIAELMQEAINLKKANGEI